MEIIAKLKHWSSHVFRNRLYVFLILRCKNIGFIEVIFRRKEVCVREQVLGLEVTSLGAV